MEVTESTETKRRLCQTQAGRGPAPAVLYIGRERAGVDTLPDCVNVSWLRGCYKYRNLSAFPCILRHFNCCIWSRNFCAPRSYKTQFGHTWGTLANVAGARRRERKKDRPKKIKRSLRHRNAPGRIRTYSQQIMSLLL